MTDLMADLKQKLVDAGLVLAAAGQGDFTRGHISVRTPDDPGLFFMKPHSVGFEEFTIESIVTCNLEGEKIAGAGRRHSEVFIHSEILRARADVNAVVHAHPKYAIVFCAADRPWPVVSQACAMFVDGLATYAETVDLIRDQDTGAALARTLGPHKAVFMRSHGVTVTGASIEAAVIRLLTLERACEDQLLAHMFGGPPPAFAPQDVASLRRNLDRHDQYVVNFEYLVRRARREANGAL